MDGQGRGGHGRRACEKGSGCSINTGTRYRYEMNMEVSTGYVWIWACTQDARGVDGAPPRVHAGEAELRATTPEHLKAGGEGARGGRTGRVQDGAAGVRYGDQR